MFTGLIEEIGTVRNIKKTATSVQLTISAKKILADVKQGDSICTNGACLTVTALDSVSFSVDVMAETVRKTNIKNLKPGSKVNLERALCVGDRLGGHMVSGHIDGIGVIKDFKREGISVWVTISTNSDILKYIINKGSITIDGISLTVAYVDDTIFKVSIIPHTAGETTLLDKKPGDIMNLECDIMGKYIEKLMFHKEKEQSVPKKDIDLNFLIENGF
ncbi:MAG: riboflavin synthase [Bacteroidota bacterium]|nr:riboflavin synthase [Bacteroidota bacterium]